LPSQQVVFVSLQGTAEILVTLDGHFPCLSGKDNRQWEGTTHVKKLKLCYNIKQIHTDLIAVTEKGKDVAVLTYSPLPLCTYEKSTQHHSKDNLSLLENLSLPKGS